MVKSAFAGSLAVLLAGIARAATINVPGDYATIQAAIDAAMDTDEIVVAPGTYAGPIDFLGKAITVRSSTGDPATATISGGSPVLTFAGNSTQDAGGAVYCDASSPVFTDCVFTQNCATGLLLEQPQSVRSE